MILAPYVWGMLHKDTEEALLKHAPDVVEWVEIDKDDHQHYSRVLRDAWLREGELIIVEHDIVINDQVLPGFKGCSQPWCGNPYPVGYALLVALGCTRFSAHLKHALPGLMDEAAAIELDGGNVPAGDWRRMDIRIGAALEAHGHQRHWHQPPVEHRHSYFPAQPV